MNASKAFSPDSVETFWAIVRECLREFHRMTTEEARRKAIRLRGKLESMTKDQIELFYHSEPFGVACDIANRQLKAVKYLDRYVEIRDEKYGSGVSKQVVRKRS